MICACVCVGIHMCAMCFREGSIRSIGTSLDSYRQLTEQQGVWGLWQGVVEKEGRGQDMSGGGSGTLEGLQRNRAQLVFN